MGNDSSKKLKGNKSKDTNQSPIDQESMNYSNDDEIMKSNNNNKINSENGTSKSNNKSNDNATIPNKTASNDNDYAFDDDDDDAFDDDDGDPIDPMDAMDDDEKKTENDYEFDDDDEDDGGWGDDDDMELLEDGQQKIIHDEDEDAQVMLKRALEKRRIDAADVKKFWKCGKCTFLNHPSRAICMSCRIPQIDIVYHILQTDMKDDVKTCPKCQGVILAEQYEDHIIDCQPLAIDHSSKLQSWFVQLTSAEKRAITHVQGLAMNKSTEQGIKQQLNQKLQKIAGGKYANEESIKKLHEFMEWEVPIIIRVHCAKLIPLLLKDTHYRNLFEIGRGSGGNDQNRRKLEEGKMFDKVYDDAKACEKPKYGMI